MLARIDSIRTDGGTQSRDGIDQATVEAFADAMHNGDRFPPIEIMHDGTAYWLVDGFHRVRAALFLGMDTIEANVTQGTQQDAAWASCGANKTHGLRRTNADKRRAVTRALTLRPDWSDRKIAEHVGVGHVLVSKMRGEMTVHKEQSAIPAPARTGRDGRTINTANIGARNQAARPKAEPAPEYDDCIEISTDPEVIRKNVEESNAREWRGYASFVREYLERIDHTHPAGAAELAALADWIYQRLEA